METKDFANMVTEDPMNQGQRDFLTYVISDVRDFLAGLELALRTNDRELAATTLDITEGLGEELQRALRVMA